MRLLDFLERFNEFDKYNDNAYALVSDGIIRARVDEGQEADFKAATFFLLQYGFELHRARHRPWANRLIQEYDFCFVPDGTKEDPVHFDLLNMYGQVSVHELGHAQIGFPPLGFITGANSVFKGSEWPKVAIATCYEPDRKYEFMALLRSNPEVHLVNPFTKECKPLDPKTIEEDVKNNFDIAAKCDIRNAISINIDR